MMILCHIIMAVKISFSTKKNLATMNNFEYKKLTRILLKFCMHYQLTVDFMHTSFDNRIVQYSHSSFSVGGTMDVSSKLGIHLQHSKAKYIDRDIDLVFCMNVLVMNLFQYSFSCTASINLNIIGFRFSKLINEVIITKYKFCFK